MADNGSSSTDQQTDQSTQSGAQTGQQGQQNETTYTAPATQEDLDRIVQNRLAKERARYSDYDDVKAKAKKFDEAEEANKSEIEKERERAATAEARASKAEADSLRYRIAAKHSISDEDTDLFLTGTDEETLIRQAERLKGRTDDSTKNGNRVPKEGTGNSTVDSEEREVARGLFGG